MPEKISLKDKKVLIVDDDRLTLAIVGKYFTTLEAQVDYASDGQEAVDKIKENYYDICIMDIYMPKLNGFEATEIIRIEIQAYLPIIALTGRAAEGRVDRFRCLAAGMNDFFTKPFNKEKCDKIIFKFLTR